MAAKRKGLGRGLDALLGGAQNAGTESPEPAVAGKDAAVRELPIELIERGRFQPRRNFDADKLDELARSISAQGVVQPIVVRPMNGGKYEIIAGERRWRAAQQASLAEIPVVVREIDDRGAMAVALIENIQRDDLNPLE
ncbi:MAG: ParB/RepB/Spo0J family partition protein, partial [Pseudomonadota bacterium]